MAPDTARAKEAAETKQKQLAEVAKVAAELKTLTADGDEVHAEIESLRERARIQAARDAQQARADLEAELEDVRAQVREATAERDAMHASIEGLREKARVFAG